eukprot:18551-Heterococcus_DN1.PRE.7
MVNIVITDCCCFVSWLHVVCKNVHIAAYAPLSAKSANYYTTAYNVDTLARSGLITELHQPKERKGSSNE